MEERYQLPETDSWKDVLEYVSVTSLREYEKGEPVIEVFSNEEATPLDYLLYPIAPLNKPTVLFGDPGAGKSQLAIIFMMILSLPWHDNKLQLKPCNDPVKSLFLDYEADVEDVRRQLRYLTDGMELGLTNLYYRRCSTPLADDLEAIQNNIDNIGARCVIIDSTSLAAGGDLNHMDVATSYFRSLRQLNITTISLAHTSKDRETHNKTILGSVLFEAGARSVWEVRGQEEENALDIVMLHRKANLSARSKPLGYKLSYDPNSIKISWHDPESIPEFVERMGTQARILSAIKSNTTMTADQLKEDLPDLTINNIRRVLSYLKDKSKIILLDRGVYGLASKQISLPVS